MLGKIRVNVRRVSGPWKAAWPRGQAAVQGRKFKAQLESGVAAWPAFIRLPATVSPQSVVSGVTLPSLRRGFTTPSDFQRNSRNLR